MAYSNGANDNFKGVATLFGSKTVSYKSALTLATIATLLGSISSIILAESLVKSFSGKGLVPDTITTSPNFLISVVLATALTVILATLFGFPVSTTHALTGGLVGGGFMAVGSQVNLSVLGKAFFLPLLLSPFIAIFLSFISYLFFRFVRIKTGIAKEYCVCIDNVKQSIPMPEANASILAPALEMPSIVVANKEKCKEKYLGEIFGVKTQSLIDSAHYLSAGTVCFARSLNDTPKIVALLLAIKSENLYISMIAVSIAMMIGGLLNSKKVAETMSKKITTLNSGQAFTANLVTGFLVIFASKLGVPVSTTHVSVGSLFGIGFITKEVNLKVISSIILSWVLTLPISALLSAFI